MPEIHLTKGLVSVVDEDDFAFASRHKYYAQPGHRTFYAVRCGTRDAMGRRKRYYLHRELMGLPPHERGGLEVDHVDRDGLNNRRANLRVVTHRENSENRPNNRRLSDIPCATCGVVFRPINHTVKYCSRRCFGLHPDNPRTQRVLPDLVCPVCGEVFRPANHRVRYCSLSCRSKGVWANRR